MLVLLSILFISASLMNGFLFNGSMFWSILTAVSALVFLAFRLFFAKKLKAPVINIVTILAMVVLFSLSFSGGMKAESLGYISYDTSILKADDLLQKKDFFKALEVLDKLEKDYGSNDKLLLMKTQASLGNSNIPAANQYLSLVSNKREQQYYTLLAQTYYLQKDYKKVQEIYVEAARNYPLWSEAQLLAGAQSADNKDYPLSKYYLLRAAEQMPDDSRPLYYLGVISFEQGNYKEAETYFSDAVRLGLDGELAGYTAWYQQEMRGAAK